MELIPKAAAVVISVAMMPPVVVKTVPQSGTTNVDPSTTEIRVTFSKDMMDGSWSWSQISGETFPETTGKPHYLADKRTCVLPVKLQPGKTYVSWLNSEKFGNFKDTDGRSAVPYLLVFETAKEAAAAAGPSRLIGRTTVRGDDVGVVFNYELGKPLTHGTIQQYVPVENISRTRGVQITLTGSLHVPANTTVLAWHTGGSPTGGVHRLYIDGDEVGSIGDDTVKDIVYRLELDAGVHPVKWVLSGGDFGRCVLQFVDLRTKRPLRVTVSEAEEAAAKEPPMKKEVDNFSAERLPLPTAVLDARAIANTPASKFAKVKVHSGGTFLPLREGARLYKDFEYQWMHIPAYLDKMSFLQSPSAYQGVTKFEIEKSGVLLLAVTSRWKDSGNPGGDWMDKVTSREDFLEQGWRKLGRLHQTTRTPGEECGYHWDVYTRECRQGETFDLRTEKYAAPIILSRAQGLPTGTASGPAKADWAPQITPRRDWGPEQATGVPDTARAGDRTTAWASNTEDGQPEWLLLEYAQPIRAAEVHVYESFNPGALSKITAFDADGKEAVVWQRPVPAVYLHEWERPSGVDTTKGYPGIESTVTRGGVTIPKFPVKADIQIQRVKLYLDSPWVKSWNEIDAVGLLDQQGKTHWATKAEASSTFATPWPKLPEPVEIPQDAVRLTHTGDTSDDKRSLGGSGHAIAFGRPARAKSVVALEIFASRYGLPQPPQEDFHVYLLDQDQKIIKDLTYPYSMILRSSKMRWYTLAVPGVEVPEKFHVAFSFNPHRTKGIYLGVDKNVDASHSYVGLPDSGFEPVSDGYDWMVRAYLVAPADTEKSENPFAD